MKLVVDTNILFTYFWPKSVFCSLLNKNLRLLSPEYAITELCKYAIEIQSKTKLSKKQFFEKLHQLKQIIIFVPLNAYSHAIPDIAIRLRDDQELLNDIDFLTLSFTENCPLWTNDALLKQQLVTDILTTKELLVLLEPAFSE